MVYTEKLFKIILVIAILLSFYIFISVVIFNNDKYKKLYTNWQLPMLCAIGLDIWLVTN